MDIFVNKYIPEIERKLKFSAYNKEAGAGKRF